MTALQDGTIDVWDPDGNRLMTMGEPGTTLLDVTVAPDGNTVTTVDFFGVVRRWDIAARPSPAPPVVVVDGIGVINSVAFAPDGSGFAVATSNGRVETIDDAGGWCARSTNNRTATSTRSPFRPTRRSWRARWASGEVRNRSTTP